MNSLTLKNNITELSKLAPFVEQFCEVEGIDMHHAFQIQLVLDEAVTNVVRYAYGDKTDMPITINADITDNDEGRLLTLQIIDSGIAFNPITNAPEVDTTLSADEREIGGLGIFLIQQTMDMVDYQRAEGNNILTMQKNL